LLDLRFSSFGGRVTVACDKSQISELSRLRVRFTTATSVSQTGFELGIDDFLLNLPELISWPQEDSDWRWQPELRALIETNDRDSRTVAGTLSGRPQPAQIDWPADASWDAPLTNFQTRDLRNLLRLTHGANFSVPGAGKTRVTLANFFARRLAGEVDRLCVVAPKSAFESWRYESTTCFAAKALSTAVYEGGTAPSVDLLLVNYERLPDAKAALIAWLKQTPAMLVLDEAHRMKRGQDGAWGSACLELGPYACRRQILTGTPAPNGAADLENLFSFVWPGKGRDVVRRTIAGNDLRAASQLLKPLFVRTTKDELGLPPMDLRMRVVSLPPLHRELYQALVGQASAQWSGNSTDLEALGRVLLYLLMAATTPALLAAGASRYEPLAYRVPPLDPPSGSTLGSLLRDLPHYETSPKYEEVLSIVSANASAGRKTLIWSTFVRNLTSLHQLLGQFSPSMVHGGTENRDEELRRFRSDNDCMVLLSNPSTLGEGVSLHHACHEAVYIDRDFAAGRFLQSVDRIHRLGLAPDTKTRVTVLVAAGTIDELVAQRLELKLQFLGGILDDPAVVQLGDLEEEPTIGAGMDPSDLQALIGHLKSAGAA
jgi:hypothetical protein